MGGWHHHACYRCTGNQPALLATIKLPSLAFLLPVSREVLGSWYVGAERRGKPLLV